MKRFIPYILALILSLASCSDNSDAPVLIENPSLRLSLHVTAGAQSTRADGPSAADGWLAANEKEYEVRNATLFFYRDNSGVNGNASTPIAFSVYFPTFTKDNSTSSSTSDAAYTSAIVSAGKSIAAGEYHVVAVCNLGNLTDKAATLGDLQTMTTDKVVTLGQLDRPSTCQYFAMSNAADETVTLQATANMTDPKNGALTDMSLSVQRLAARIDFSPGNTKGWNTALTSFNDGTATETVAGSYEYAIDGGDADDRFYLTGVVPVNLYNDKEFVLKRVTTDKSLTSETIYLGSELVGADNNGANYVLTPYTAQIAASTTVSYANPCTTWANSFSTVNSEHPIAQLTAGTDNCYAVGSDLYRPLAYAKENTVPVGASKENYVTGLVITGYYKKATAIYPVRKSYVYYIRHTDPSNSNSENLVMKYGIVRNHVYQVKVDKVMSMGIILLEVKDWIPEVAPDIDI